MKIGLALGAGGARGLAHIVFLEVFEELGIKPHIIAGTSIGAIIGAVYASGISAKEIKETVDEIIFTKNIRLWEIYKRSDIIKAFNFIDPKIKTGGLIKGKKLVDFLGEKIKVKNFDELKIPMKIVATDFKTNEMKILETGNLLNAIQASYSIPGFFAPVRFKNTLMIDGGISNPLPYDIIQDDVDIIIAIDVTTNNIKNIETTPAAYEILFAGFQMMQRSIIKEKLKRIKPDIYIDTQIRDVKIHEFKKVNLIYKQVQSAKEKLKKKLDKILSAKIVA